MRLSRLRIANLWQPTAAGILNSLCFPMAFGGEPFNSHPLFSVLAWFAPALFFGTLERDNMRANFWRGLCYGLGCYLPTLYWITHSMVHFGGLTPLVSTGVLGILSLYLSLYPALWGALWQRFGTGWRQLVCGAAVWVFLEYVRGYLLTGFPWCNLAYTQGNLLSVMQLTDLAGVYGLAAWLVALNLIVLSAWRHGKQKQRLQAGGMLGLFVLLAAGGMLYGQWRLQDIRNAPTGAQTRVTLVQGNIPQGQKWLPEKRQEILGIYHDLSLPQLASSDLIVWPEASYPYSLPYQTTRAPYIRLPQSGATDPLLLFGAPSYIPESRQIMNSLFAAQLDGTVLKRYDKIRLVLYGEYVPLADFAPIRKLTQAVGNFTSGSQLVALPFQRQQGVAGSAGPLICYEIIYPDLARGYAQQGVDMLLNITNDAWFGKSSGPYQHLNISRFRAVENRLPIARAANTGISAFIAPSGELIDTLALDTRGTLQQNVTGSELKSLYTAGGDAPFLLGLVLALILAAALPSRH